jgi:transcriptional regulator with XRE-family HTH domain
VLTLSLGEQLRYLRDKRDLTRKEVAQKLQIIYGTYSKYESGEREPDYETLKRIAAFFEVSVDNLVGSNLPNIDDINNLPEDAKKEIEEYVRYIKFKYRKK